MRVATFLLLGLTFVSTATSQQADTASIEGVVVKLGTDAPVAGAIVELSVASLRRTQLAVGPPDLLTVTTGGDGKFTFRNLKAREYRLVATYPGGIYNPAEFGQRTPREHGTTLSLAVGQTVKDARLEMAATGSISGRIVGRNNEPVGVAQVMAVQLWCCWEDGRRLMRFVQSAQTDDLGNYRLFWLPPGQYYIAARPENLNNGSVAAYINFPGQAPVYTEMRQSAPPISRRILESGDVIQETFDLVYYGGGTDPEKAQSVELKSGASLGSVDIDITSGSVRARTIRGRITGIPLPLTSFPRLSVVPRTLGPSNYYFSPSIDQTGAFTISGVASSSYIAVANTQDGLIGTASIEAGSDDVDNFTIVMRAGVPITGRVALEGTSSSVLNADLSRLRIGITEMLSCLLCRIPPTRFAASPSTDGTFTIPGVGPAGWDYQVQVDTSGMPQGGIPGAPVPAGNGGVPGAYVKSIRLGSIDLLRTPLRLDGAIEGRLEIVMGIGTGTVEGHVMNATRQTAIGSTVILVPEASLRLRRDFYKKATTDSSGVFRIQGITPGDYKVFAFDAIEDGAWMDSGFSANYENRGRTIRIGESATEAVDLTSITQPR